MKKFFAMTLIVFGAIALSGVAAHAADSDSAPVPTNTDPHKAPGVWDCDSFRFDPPGQIAVTIEFDHDGEVHEQSGTYTPDADHVVTVPIHDLVDGFTGQIRAVLPDIFPGAWTQFVTLDCRHTPPPTTPTTAPPVPPTVAPPAPAVPVTTPVIATGPGTPGDLATTGAGTDITAIVGGLALAAGCAVLIAARKWKVA